MIIPYHREKEMEDRKRRERVRRILNIKSIILNTENCLLSFPFDDLINTGNTGLFEHCLKRLPLELIYAN